MALGAEMTSSDGAVVDAIVVLVVVVDFVAVVLVVVVVEVVVEVKVSSAIFFVERGDDEGTERRGETTQRVDGAGSGLAATSVHG